ncbi:MAG: NUDIX domain-containing protein [Alphaproteobacteria bacterium]|nr:NUDIX domain-containing protein [Alphaproteobacteria bacterium]
MTPDRRSTVLVHHKKLNRWLQPGGHADGNGNLFEVALHEAFEETGLDLPIFTPVNSLIFDIDVQTIPKHGAKPAHMHYDIRYIFQLPDINLPGNDQSCEVLFVPIEEVKEFNNTASVERMALKTKYQFSNT